MEVTLDGHIFLSGLKENQSRCEFCTHDERLLVDVVHVQSHQVLPAAQVQPALVLVHQQDAVVAGVEGETERPRRPGVHQLCEEREEHLRHLENQRQREITFTVMILQGEIVLAWQHVTKH